VRLVVHSSESGHIEKTPSCSLAARPAGHRGAGGFSASRTRMGTLRARVRIPSLEIDRSRTRMGTLRARVRTPSLVIDRSSVPWRWARDAVFRERAAALPPWPQWSRFLRDWRRIPDAPARGDCGDRRNPCFLRNAAREARAT